MKPLGTYANLRDMFVQRGEMVLYSAVLHRFLFVKVCECMHTDILQSDSIQKPFELTVIKQSKKYRGLVGFYNAIQ